MTTLHHVPCGGWVPEEKPQEKPQTYNYFIAFLCLKERYKLDNLPTITTIYKLGEY